LSSKRFKKDTEGKKEFVFTIKPVMGEQFTIKLSDDSTVFDLKDQIQSKSGVAFEMQLLAVADRKLNFDDEEQFILDMKLPEFCSILLSLKVTTGSQVVNDNCFDDEDFLIYDIIPTGSSSVRSKDSLSDEESDGEKNYIVSIPTSSLPLPVIESYINNSLTDEEKGDEGIHIHVSSLQSLRLSNEDNVITDIPARPTTPFPIPASISLPKNKEELAPAFSTGPVRCRKCGIKCRLASQFKCRCGDTFCGQHRYHDQHDCSFDHKAHDRSKLDAANPKVYKSTIEQL